MIGEGFYESLCLLARVPGGGSETADSFLAERASVCIIVE